MEAFTKQIRSYVVNESPAVDFVLETINKLIDEHKISLHTETIVHSEQGCHYTDHSFISVLKGKKFCQSMS